MLDEGSVDVEVRSSGIKDGIGEVGIMEDIIRIIK